MSASVSQATNPAPRATKGAKISKLRPATPKLEVGTIVQVSPSALRVEPGYNVRSFDPSDSDDARFIKAVSNNGVTEPLTAWQDKDGTLYVQAGHRRLATVLYLNNQPGRNSRNFATVPVRIVERESDAKHHADILISNYRRDLSPLQQAVWAKRMIDAHGYNESGIAAIMGHTVKQVKNLLAMNDLPAALHTMIERDNIAATLALELTRELGTEQAVAAITAALEERAKVTPFTEMPRVTRQHVMKANENVRAKGRTPRQTEGKAEPAQTPATPATPAPDAVKIATERAFECETAVKEATHALQNAKSEKEKAKAKGLLTQAQQELQEAREALTKQAEKDAARTQAANDAASKAETAVGKPAPALAPAPETFKATHNFVGTGKDRIVTVAGKDEKLADRRAAWIARAMNDRAVFDPFPV